MKHKFKIGLLAFALLCALFTVWPPLTSTAETVTMTRDLAINNQSNTVAITLQKGTASSSNFLECLAGSNVRFELGTNGIVGVSYGGTGTNSIAGIRSVLGVATNVGGAFTNMSINGQTNVNMTASLPVWTDVNKMLTNFSLADTRATLGVPTNSGGFVTNLSINGQTNVNMTASLPAFTDANKMLTNHSIANTKILLGIQAGQCVSTATGYVTNTFPTAFSAAPNVVATQFGTVVNPTNIVVSVTTTQFILYSQVVSVSNTWVAIGAP